MLNYQKHHDENAEKDDWGIPYAPKLLDKWKKFVMKYSGGGGDKFARLFRLKDFVKKEQLLQARKEDDEEDK